MSHTTVRKCSLWAIIFFVVLVYELSAGYHMERGGMPLHDAVGINCKKGTTTEHQDSAVKYMG